jgi:hypothetical protein
MLPNFNVQIGCAMAHDDLCQSIKCVCFITEDDSLNSDCHENFKNHIVKIWYIVIYDGYDHDMLTI